MHYQFKIYLLPRLILIVFLQCLDNPDSGPTAKVIAYLDLAIILIAVVAQCVESLPSMRNDCQFDQSWR